MVIIFGNSPLAVSGLDPGMMYSVTINVHDGTQVVLSDEMITVNITVKNILGKISVLTTYCTNYVATVHIIIETWA